MRAPSPTYFCTSSLPMTRMKQASVRLATARASSVLPVPAAAGKAHKVQGTVRLFHGIDAAAQRLFEYQETGDKQNRRCNYGHRCLQGGEKCTEGREGYRWHSCGAWGACCRGCIRMRWSNGAADIPKLRKKPPRTVIHSDLTWRPVAQHALWRVNSQLHELLRVQHGQLHHLAHLLDLLLAAANVGVGDVCGITTRRLSWRFCVFCVLLAAAKVGAGAVGATRCAPGFGEGVRSHLCDDKQTIQQISVSRGRRSTWLLLNGHHGDGGVDLGRQWDLDLVLVAVNAHSHPLLNVRGRNLQGKQLARVFKRWGKDAPANGV